MPLTDTDCRNARAAADKPYKKSDGGGLFLLVQPNGGKHWRLAYRFSGKQKGLALGSYPTVSLAQARRAREDAKVILAKGLDPSHQRKIDKIAVSLSRSSTFEIVATELLAKFEKEQNAPATLKKKRWLLEFAFAEIGNRPIAEISALELLEVLRKVEKRGRYETATRLRSMASMVFRFAIATGRAERDPSADLRGALITPTVKHHAAIVDPEGIGGLLRSIDGLENSFVVKNALRLAPLVFVRPGELRHAEWTEFDLTAAVWRIPAAKMKMNREHRVPLARQSIEIIQETQKVTGSSKYLFPSSRSWHRPLSENTFNAVLRRLGYGKDEMTAHGFRSLASTRLNEMGMGTPDVIERQLAHQEANEVRRAYLHAAEFWPERVQMMSAWADYLDMLRNAPKMVASSPGT